MKLRAFWILALALPQACAQGNSKQAVQTSPAPQAGASREEDASETDQQRFSPEFEQNDNQGQPPNQNQQAASDPLALISPELRSKLTPQQVAAIQALTPEQRQNLTAEQLTNLLNANGGLPGSAVGGSANSNQQFNAQIMQQLTGLLQQGIAGLGKPTVGGQTGQAGQGQAGGGGDGEFEDEFEFE